MAATKPHKIKHTAARGRSRFPHHHYEENPVSIEANLPEKILIFLPQAAAEVIGTILANRGYVTDAVPTVPEAFDALRSDCYAFAITTRLNIALLRNIRSIPVVNLEIFFHAGPLGDDSLSTSKRFDSRAFMERIDFLARSVSARSGRADIEPVKTAIARGGRPFRWWARTRNILRLRSCREDLEDVRS